MSSRRHLVSRSRVNNHEESSPAPRSRQRDVPDRQPIALPPYEAPSCPLTPAARRALETLQHNHDYSKYRTHLGGAVKTLTTSAAQINDQLSTRQDKVRRGAEKREQTGNDATEEDNANEAYARHMGKKVDDLTSKAEKALRELIDYGDELSMQESIMKDVRDTIAAAPVPQPRAPRRRRQRGGESGEESEGEDPSQNDDVEDAEDADAPKPPSAIELLEAGKKSYTKEYASKSMLERYDVNDYREFKKIVHDAQNPGEDAPPVPHARTWFPEDNANKKSAGSRRRQNNTADDVDNSDDEVVIERATTNLKCPLTLLQFNEPFTSKKCSHTFEKYAIVEHHRKEAVPFTNNSQPGSGPVPAMGAKIIKCPNTGCDALLELSDFYIDETVKRKVQRAKRREEEENNSDDDDDEQDTRPRGMQRNRPAPIDSDDAMDVDEEEDQKQRIARVKKERQSRGLSTAPRHGADVSMEVDDDDEV